MGDLTGRSGFPSEMYGLRPSDYDCQTAGREEYPGRKEPGGGRIDGTDAGIERIFLQECTELCFYAYFCTFFFANKIKKQVKKYGNPFDNVL